MAFKKRKATVTMAAATGSVEIGLGTYIGRIHRLEVKGDDANVDDNTTFAITDNVGRVVLAATALDAGTDDSTVKATNQEFSTVGVARYIAPNEAELLSQDGTAVTDNQGSTSGVFAQSPVTVNLAAGTATDVFEITLLVEV